MASISAFERISLAEANVKALVKTVNRQAIDIQILQAQIATIMPRIPRDAQEPPAKLELARPLARMADIASKVAAENMISLPDLRSRNRERAVAWPRQDAMRLMIDAGYSTTQIGRFFQRDHTTVISGARASRARMEGGRSVG